MAADERNPNAQSPKSLKVQDQRALNHLEPGGLAEAQMAYAAADLPVEIDAAWGTPFRCTGYERLIIALGFTQATHTAVHIGLQACATGDGAAADWYDVYDDEAVPGTLARRVFTLTTGANARVVFGTPVVGPWMRLKVWGTGGLGTGDRATLHLARVMYGS